MSNDFVIFRNNFLAEYSCAEPEGEFIRCCEELDQSRFDNKKIDELNQNIEDLTKVPVYHDETHAPIVFVKHILLLKNYKSK